MFSKIALALDGTAACERAVEVAQLAATGGCVTIIHVQTGADESEKMRVVDAQIAELNRTGINTELSWTDGLLGGEADEIAAVAESVGAEAIIVATRGLSPVKGVLLGSTTQKLLHEAKRVIIVVPPST